MEGDGFMRKINLNAGYKISEARQKRYIEHYHIPANECLVVPTRNFGEEAQCEVRWEDESGEMHFVHRLVFKADNLTPINPLLDTQLFKIWGDYYGQN